MKKRSIKQLRSESTTGTSQAFAFRQLELPMVLASEALKKGMMAFVHAVGVMALEEFLEMEAESLAGPKGSHANDRTHNLWGSAKTPLPFGGRQVVVKRPRVRRKEGGEVTLPSVELLREADPMSVKVAEQIVVGVSTRGYDRSLDGVDEALEPRGTSKSNVSRALVERTSEKLIEALARRLEHMKLAAMFIDGIEVGGHAVVIAMGVTQEGVKEPLGVWLGSTENSTVATALLQSLIERGLSVNERLLFIIDGGKGIRKAITDVFGDRALVQRCQVHKMRNVKEHLPEARRKYVVQQMRAAYKCKSFATAKKLLKRLGTWLERSGEDSAAASLKEGLDETLTVLKLALPPTLRRTLSTTNAIENLNGTLRRVSRNVKRWRTENMIARWVALGIEEAQRGFRRVKGHRDIPRLLEALGHDIVARKIEAA